MDGAVGMDADVIEPLAVPLRRLVARGLQLSSATFGRLPQRRSAGFATSLVICHFEKWQITWLAENSDLTDLDALQRSALDAFVREIDY